MDLDAPDGLRDGEIAFPDDAAPENGPSLRFIGRIRSAWTTRGDCPKNVAKARERGGGKARIEVAPDYRLALQGLAAGQWIIALSWLDGARRDLALQMPRHAESPRGTFSLRSPVRPNPIGLHLVQIVEIDREAGRLLIDAVDVLDGTPLLDLKPYLPGVDMPPADAA